nr:phospholipid carrier-dependent glycosyltransferase [Granulicoccus phenolivorans]
MSAPTTTPPPETALRPKTMGSELNSWLVTIGIVGFAFILRLVNLGRPANLVFDETYYAKDAWSLLQYGYEGSWADDSNARILNGDLSGLSPDPSFIVHPQLGKWLIAAGEALFGMNSFGWRFMPLVFGCLLILFTIRVTRRLSRSTLIGAIAGLLLTFDGLAFVMSRIALLDIFQASLTMLAVWFLLMDRDWYRTRLANYLRDHGLHSLNGQLGPIFWFRPWRLAVGITFGLAIGVKWNTAVLLAAFSVLSVLWDYGARRLAGARIQAWPGALIDAAIAFVHQVLVAVVVYVLTWWSWLTTSGGYDRHTNANPLLALLKYHGEIWAFHNGDFIRGATHTYDAKPIGWLVMARPIGIDAVNDIQPGTDGCPPGGENCLRVITGMGTPVLWWIGVFALAAAIVLWLLNRDWRFAVPVVGLFAAWLPWFPNSERPVFFFYAIMMIPFTCIAIALCLGALIGRPGGPRRVAGAITAGVVLALVMLNFAFIYPILTDQLLTYSQWRMRMWFASWV